MSEVNASEIPGSELTVAVSRTVSKPVKEVWRVLMTKDGAECLLGEGAEFGQKGHTWTSTTGRTGVIRSLHPLEEIRFSYRKDDHATPSIVEILLNPEGDSTTLKITHSNLLPRTNTDELTAKWEAALARLDEFLAA
jgi:uncharacterized protein YndB with AHSA1/START domain